MPVNVTISTNFRCNFRCLSCNVYERKVKELDAEEWDPGLQVPRPGAGVDDLQRR